MDCEKYNLRREVYKQENEKCNAIAFYIPLLTFDYGPEPVSLLNSTVSQFILIFLYGICLLSNSY